MQALGASEKVFELIEREPEIDLNSADFQPDELAGHIEFDKVSFSYPSRPDQAVLKVCVLICHTHSHRSWRSILSHMFGNRKLLYTGRIVSAKFVDATERPLPIFVHLKFQFHLLPCYFGVTLFLLPFHERCRLLVVTDLSQCRGDVPSFKIFIFLLHNMLRKCSTPEGCKFKRFDGPV